MKSRFYHILILILICFSAFSQSPNDGIVPPVGGKTKLQLSEQARQSKQEYQILMTNGNKKVVYWDTAHVKELLNLGKVDSIATVVDTTFFYDRDGVVVGKIVKNGTDTRLQLSVVNDSLKVEIIDVATNVVLSTSYIDNVGNHPETITTITDTLVGAHLIANYNNEANTIRGIYESIIQVDSITNGYVITKEDGLKDTIKLNPTGFYTLTSLDDTLALTTIAASKCPALTVAKLDSCNVAYLFMFNCETGSWELFKTPNVYTAGKTLFVDEVTGNDATAKKGCPTCSFKDPLTASNSLQYFNEDLLKIENGIYNISGEMFNSGSTTALIDLSNNSTIISNINRGLIGTVSDGNGYYSTPINKTIISGNGTIINNGNSSCIKPFNQDGILKIELDKYQTNFRGQLVKTNNKDVDIYIKEINAACASPFGFFRGKNCKINLNADNINNFSSPLTLASLQLGMATFEAGNSFINNQVNVNIKNCDKTRKWGSVINITASDNIDSTMNNSFNVNIGVLKQKREDTLFTYGIDDLFPTTALFSHNCGQSSHYEQKNNINFKCDNCETDYSVANFGAGNDIFIDNNYNFNGNYITHFLPSINFISVEDFRNSTIIINGNYYNDSGYPLLRFSNSNFYNTKIILKGNFISTGKVIEITGGSFDATSSIELQGTFKTTSTTLPAIDINNSRLFLKDCDIITGGGYSIDSATPVNVTVKPGCASNVTTSANVIQLGTGIYVDPNFNN